MRSQDLLPTLTNADLADEWSERWFGFGQCREESCVRTLRDFPLASKSRGGVLVVPAKVLRSGWEQVSKVGHQREVIGGDLVSDLIDLSKHCIALEQHGADVDP